MRFAYVCADPGIPVPGRKGASIHVASLCRALVAEDLTGEIYSIRPEGVSLAGLPVRPIAVPPRRKRKSREEREARLFLASLDSTIAPETPPDFVYERYTLWHAGGLARSREWGVPFILEVNSPLPEEARRYRGLANEPLAEGLAQLLLREADGLVCVSEQVAEWVTERRGHATGVWVVPNGVDPDLFAPHPDSRPEPLPPPEVPLVAFCGSFRPWHGLDDLLNGFRLLVAEQHVDAHLLCVGDGPMREEFEEKANRLGVGARVHLTGELPQEEVPAWLGGASLAVAPYPRLEGFYFSPLKIFEFLSLGLPVVASAIGQITELIPHRERGYLYPPGDSTRFAAMMAHLLRDHNEAERIARCGRKWVLEHATWRRRAREILDHIEALP